MDNTKIDINTMLDMKNEILELRTYLNGLTNQVSKEIIDYKEECITQALIELGWTPPASHKNLTRYDCKVIDAGTHQYTDMVPCCHGGYVKYEDVVETSSNSVQQLNAEISAMISKWKHCCKLGVDWYEVELSDYERLQKLSAV